MDDFGSFEDLRTRLYTLSKGGEQRLVMVLGAGLSNAVVPGIAGLIPLFREKVPRPRQLDFDRSLAKYAELPDKFQEAARQVQRKCGAFVVPKTVREAILSACTDIEGRDLPGIAGNVDECGSLQRTGTWRIPEGYKRFADFYASLSGASRGPIVTTNFDPLIEIALEEAGVRADTVSIPTDRVPTPQQLALLTGTPVMHIHGFWTENATLITHTQIERDRQDLVDLLRWVMTNSLVLVLGYGAWRDAFTTTLLERVKEVTSLNSELAWAAHAPNLQGPIAKHLLAKLGGSPGVTFYAGVDGHALFSEVTTLHDEQPPSGIRPSLFGYTQVHSGMAEVMPTPIRFADGRAPTWGDAKSGQWPLLDSGELLLEEARRCMHLAAGGVVAVGPMGEGKSLALRQVALRVSEEFPEWYVLWREPVLQLRISEFAVTGRCSPSCEH